MMVSRLAAKGALLVVGGLGDCHLLHLLVVVEHQRRRAVARLDDVQNLHPRAVELLLRLRLEHHVHRLLLGLLAARRLGFLPSQLRPLSADEDGRTREGFEPLLVDPLSTDEDAHPVALELALLRLWQRDLERLLLLLHGIVDAAVATKRRELVLQLRDSQRLPLLRRRRCPRAAAVATDDDASAAVSPPRLFLERLGEGGRGRPFCRVSCHPSPRWTSGNGV
mmetsp:Transcript_27771/g.60852  ORF Transcript_27771/g.60852 Transcript_27771/m.60852 type:complete len:223 (-) Transcript_27771:435-1103(-)